MIWFCRDEWLWECKVKGRSKAMFKKTTTTSTIEVWKIKFLPLGSAQPTTLDTKPMLLTALESVRVDQIWSCDIPQVQRTLGLYPQRFLPLTYANGAFHQSQQSRTPLLSISYTSQHSTLDNYMACKPHVNRIYVGMEFISYHLTHDPATYCLRIPLLLTESLTAGRILSLGFSFNLCKWHFS